MSEVVITGAVRTPIGSFGGVLSPLSAIELGAVVIKSAINRAGIRQEDVDETIMGNTLQAGLGQNPCRQAAVKAGIPISAPGMTINEVCGSGLKAVILAAQTIMTGNANIVVAGGMESMSQAPYALNKARWGYRMGHSELNDLMIQDSLWCPFNDYHMGVTAENIAEHYHISRKEQDEFAAHSQQKAERAMNQSRFASEIEPVSVPQRKGEPLICDKDEHPRPGTRVEKLASLSPAFKEDGTVTPGNASGINDGAAAFVLMAKERAEAMGLDYFAGIRSYATVGVEPAFMGLGPVYATKKALERCGLTVKDMDLIELNEAFAAQSIAVARELDFDMERVNVNGGAIALGHPIGASGARILVTLLYEMREREVKMGLATLCVGGGEGVSLIVER